MAKLPTNTGMKHAPLNTDDWSGADGDVATSKTQEFYAKHKKHLMYIGYYVVAVAVIYVGYKALKK